MARRKPKKAPQVGFQRQRIELVARLLCDLDDTEPGGPLWGAAIMEATRFVGAFDVLRMHAQAVNTARCEEHKEH